MYFSSLILTRRVSVWFLFISITHGTSTTLRSRRDRGVKMTLCVRMFLFPLRRQLRKIHKSQFTPVSPCFFSQYSVSMCYFTPLARIVLFFFPPAKL